MCRAFGRRTLMGPWFERVGADALARLDDGLRACGLAAVTPLVSGVAIPASATFPLAIPTQTEWPFVTVHAPIPAFVVPSKNRAEALVIIEAGSAGRPSATRSRPRPEAARTGSS